MEIKADKDEKKELPLSQPHSQLGERWVAES